jgi:hypothetical protein
LGSLLPRFASSLASVLLLLSACDHWALFINSDGVLAITIVNGSAWPGGFRVRIRDVDGGTSRIVDVPPSADLSLDGLGAGELELTLLAPTGCRVAEPNPRMVTTDPDKAVRIAFEVHC